MNSVFQALYELVESDLSEGTKLSKFNIFVMFFLELQLNLHVEFCCFGVHKGTVYRHFHGVLNILYKCMESLIKWPDKEMLCLNMPTKFSENG